VVSFSQLWVPTKPKFRLRSAQPLKRQRSRSRFRYRNARKQATQNSAAKKKKRQKATVFDSLFVNFLQHSHFRPTPREILRRSPPYRDARAGTSKEAVEAADAGLLAVHWSRVSDVLNVEPGEELVGRSSPRRSTKKKTPSRPIPRFRVFQTFPTQ
jgi:hypothetical protein